MPKYAGQRVEDALLDANRALETRTQELARSVAILRATLEATTDGILVSDAAHPISMFNRRFVEMWRVPEAILQHRDRAALLAFTSQQLVDGDAYVRRIEQLHAESPPDSYDILELRDGRVFERFSSIQYIEGEKTGRVWSFRDISERLAAERALVEETRVLDLLNRTGMLLSAQLDLHSLVQAVTDAATQLSGAKFGAFFYNVQEPSGDAYMLYTLSGAPREAFDKLGHPRATPLFEPTFTGERSMRLDDVLQDSRYGHFAPHFGMPAGHLPVRSYLAAAVTSRDGSVIGGLFFAHPEPAVFTARSERLVVNIAAQAGVAIDNARLFEAARRSAQEREQLLDSERAARSEAERMSALKDEFLATLSHELRTPLSAILGWSQVLRLRAEDTQQVREGLHTIERNARVQIQLIEDLLDMSRITSGKVRLDVQAVDPVAFVEAAIATVAPGAEAKGVRIETRLDRSGGPVTGDPGRLQQVAWNLLANAVKFTPGGGKVQVRLERMSSHIELCVADTGVGIRPEFLPHVFERFRQDDASTTRMFGGLGLGLSIVKQLVELHGGTVHVASAGINQGSTFTVRLPLKAAYGRHDVEGRTTEDASPAHSFDFERADLSGLTVLVVDDEPDARELVKRVLAECQARVLTAPDAATALALVEAQRPDVIVSDIGMPHVDGFELLRRIRALGAQRGGNAPAIALTAFARTEDRTRVLQSGFLVHVSKPVEPSELVATVATVAGRTGPADGATG
jgi:signal transduction histidine kinase/ActR/RegA family two-component response regulator